MTNEHLKLSHQLCFSLYAATREMTKRYRPLLETLEVTYPQYLVLLVLWEEKAITVKELGETLHLDSGTLTPMLKRMESNGLVKRTRLKSDERVVSVTLTEKGKIKEQDAQCIPLKIVEGTTLSESEAIELKRLLTKVLAQQDD